jgi:hypothetical protein
MRILLVSMMLVACGGGGSDEIPATPLAGELDDLAWTAGGAIASPSQNEGTFTVRIHPDTDLDCDSFGQDPYVQLALPWVPGTQTLGLDSEVVLFFLVGDTVHLVLEGKLELADAPVDPGASTLLRLRAIFQDSDNDMFVEGEIAVQICE